MSIKSEITAWNGKSVNDIGAIYSRYHQRNNFANEVISYLSHAELQKGATWLLKKYLESGGYIAPGEVKNIYSFLSKLECWESKLHVLQSIPFMPISKTDKKKVEGFLRECLMDNNKFIRAWAYNGFNELSIQYNEYRQETEQFFEMAMRDEAPSVRSRIKNIMKQSGK